MAGTGQRGAPFATPSPAILEGARVRRRAGRSVTACRATAIRRAGAGRVPWRDPRRWAGVGPGGLDGLGDVLLRWEVAQTLNTTSTTPTSTSRCASERVRSLTHLTSSGVGAQPRQLTCRHQPGERTRARGPLDRRHRHRSKSCPASRPYSTTTPERGVTPCDQGYCVLQAYLGRTLSLAGGGQALPPAPSGATARWVGLGPGRPSRPSAVASRCLRSSSRRCRDRGER